MNKDNEETFSELVRISLYKTYRLAWKSLDWLFPPICAGCGKRGARFCTDCYSKVELIGDSVCSICGERLSQPGICKECMSNPPAYDALRSWGVFEGSLRSAILKMKYQGDISIGEEFSVPLIDLLKYLKWQIDCVVPVPLSSVRYVERGYNQAALLAKPIALGYGVAYCSKALMKIRETQTQVGLNRKQRQLNVFQAFKGIPKKIYGKNVLVVDDVATSGATMNACARALLTAGAKHVYGLTLARTILFDWREV